MNFMARIIIQIRIIFTSLEFFGLFHVFFVVVGIIILEKQGW